MCVLLCATDEMEMGSVMATRPLVADADDNDEDGDDGEKRSDDRMETVSEHSNDETEPLRTQQTHSPGQKNCWSCFPPLKNVQLLVLTGITQSEITKFLLF